MPSKTRETSKARNLRLAIEAAIAARPFDPAHAADAPENWANLPEAVQLGVAAEVARLKAGGLSGAQLRDAFGGESTANGAARDTGLTGPMRRKVLRQHGLANAATIARSYAAYTDGEARTGTAHARYHGPNAAERVAALQAEAEAAIAEAEAEAARKAAASERAAMRAALKAAGRPVPRKAAELKAAYAALSA
jgi:hypothetical protein